MPLSPSCSVRPPLFSVCRPAPPYQERDFLTRVRRLTVEGKRAGEGYWSPDGKRLVFQSEREPGNPFYQIYVLDLATGDTKRISPGIGKTTCAFFRPGTDEIEFASTHADPKSKQCRTTSSPSARRARSAAMRGTTTREMDIYGVQREDRGDEAADDRRGYDAEGSYSPDGQWIVFSSMRSAYDHPLDEKEKKSLTENPSNFAEIYIMKADGSGQKRLTNVLGLRRRPVLHPGRQEDRLAPLRRAGTDRRHLDDEPGRHRSAADHRRSDR